MYLCLYELYIQTNRRIKAEVRNPRATPPVNHPALVIELYYINLSFMINCFLG